MKEDKPGWQKAEPVERVYVKYDPKNNLPTHKATIPNQIEKEVKALTSDVCVTNEDNQNSPLHLKIYSDVTLDLDIFGSNVSNG